jgi:SAM-dependent methyltransferase
MTAGSRCLHLAASRFERLSREATALICQPGWTHLGEPPLNWQEEIREQWRFGSALGALRLAAGSLYRRWKPRYSPEELQRLYACCEFREFHFAAGDRLDFRDGEFDFIFSEHFFEHLSLPDALALFKECSRVLKPGGVVRTSVPDADLRVYAKPEPVGYPSARTPWTHHQKHRMRWSGYSLSEALTVSGLTPRPVMFCTVEGKFVHELPSQHNGNHANKWAATTAYLRRLPSLVVDGVKPS